MRTKSSYALPPLCLALSKCVIVCVRVEFVLHDFVVSIALLQAPLLILIVSVWENREVQHFDKVRAYSGPIILRLRKTGCSVEDHSQRGRPSKIARIGDLSRAYPDLQ